MIHVEHLAERILFLKGKVDMKCSGPVEKIHDVKAMLEKAAQRETGLGYLTLDHERWQYPVRRQL